MILKLTNTIKAAADGVNVAEYHFGYHSDINTATDNQYNPGGAVGRQFPLCLLVAPLSGKVKPGGKGAGALTYDVEVFFYDTQHFGHDGATRTDTMAETLERLEKKALAFLEGLKAARVGIEQADLLHDAHAHIVGLVCVGLTFTVAMPYGCDDIDAVPLVNTATVDTENEQEYVQ
jgi:hypothetical protein